MDEYELAECKCPKCGHYDTYRRNCGAFGCEDGIVNRYDEDPMWYDIDDQSPCSDCSGKGYEHWCPECGYDIAVNPEKLKVEFDLDPFDEPA